MRPCYNEATSMKSAGILEDIAACKAAGFHDMEIRKEKLMAYLRHGGTLARLKQTLDEAGIKAGCINALHGITFHRGAQVDHVKEMCEFLCYCARALGCQNLEIIATFNAPTDNIDEINEETIRMLSLLSKVARPYGVRLGLEYMGVPANSVKTFNQALDIIRGVNQDNVGILLDTWHHYAGGSTPEDILKADGKEIFVAHISDSPKAQPFTLKRPQCIWPGTGAIPLTAQLQALKEIGYNDIVSVEVFDPDVQKAPVMETAKTALETTRDALEKAGVLD